MTNNFNEVIKLYINIDYLLSTKFVSLSNIYSTKSFDSNIELLRNNYSSRYCSKLIDNCLNKLEEYGQQILDLLSCYDTIINNDLVKIDTVDNTVSINKNPNVNYDDINIIKKILSSYIKCDNAYIIDGLTLDLTDTNNSDLISLLFELHQYFVSNNNYEYYASNENLFYSNMLTEISSEDHKLRLLLKSILQTNYYKHSNYNLNLVKDITKYMIDSTLIDKYICSVNKCFKYILENISICFKKKITEIDECINRVNIISTMIESEIYDYQLFEQIRKNNLNIVENEHDRYMIVDMKNTINSLPTKEKEDFLNTEELPNILSGSPVISKILNAIEYTHHSGCSFNIILSIAKCEIIYDPIYRFAALCLNKNIGLYMITKAF